MTFGLLSQASRRADVRAIEAYRPTPPQLEFHNLPGKIGIWRDANRMGKSYSMGWDVIAYARCQHPQQRHRPPFSLLVIGTSWEQMIPFMAMIWHFAPKDELAANNDYELGRGIVGKPPRLVFVRGPGKGVTINFATYRQGSTRIAGWGLARIYADEPMPETFFGEVAPRVFDTDGQIRIGFTPTPDSPPQRWLYEKVKSGEIPEVNHGLSEASIWPRGAPVPRRTQAHIDEYEATLLDIERDMRMGRSWFATLQGAWLSRFSDANIISFDIQPHPDLWIMVGVDHGAVDGKQAAMVVAIEDRHTSRPKVYWRAETVSEGITLPEHDAKAILKMLKSCGLRYDDVDEWIGDRPTGSKKYEIRKSNEDLRRELAALLRRPVHETKTFEQPKKHAGSVTDGVRLMNWVFHRRGHTGLPHGLVHPSCEHFIEGCRTWNGHPQHPFKDPVDAGRYPVERALRLTVLSSVYADFD